MPIRAFLVLLCPYCYNESMNEKDSYTQCTKCGRPMTYCKDKCGCKPRKCEGCCCKEYGCKHKGCIRQTQPQCPYIAVIPTVTVETTSNIGELADCFVHVANINTTYYIDDKHRMIVTWAGPVEVDNYDIANNPLGLRGQTVYDFANNVAAYYNAQGVYRKITLTEN